MRIAIINAEINRPLLIKGVNLTVKPGTNRGVSMQFDTNLDCLLVNYKGGIALIPAASVNSMELVNPYELNSLPVGQVNQTETNFKHPTVESPPCHVTQPISAQVENPTQPKIGATGRGEKVGKSAA